ncbi:MAG: hypothetical protein LUH43_05005 [Clostridia bacterium]|nr:hypothetical protein [Clostridia bacterium]
MKRFLKIPLLTILAFAVLAALLSCESDTRAFVRYETYERMQDALSFTMRTVPDLEDVKSYGVMDGKLGEIEYYIENEGGRMNGTLALRIATAAYAEKYAAADTPGIAGVSISSISSSGEERIGSYTVEYYATEETVFGIWNDSSYYYSLSFTFDEEDMIPVWSDIYDYVVSVISTPNG